MGFIVVNADPPETVEQKNDEVKNDEGENKEGEKTKKTPESIC